MKIGILTFHFALNYGAVLQTYASVRFLRSMGHEAFVIDYQNADIKKDYIPARWDKARAGQEGFRYRIKFPALVLRRFGRYLAFKRFRKRFLPVIPFPRASEMDVLFIGSDQVWNKTITRGADPVYFGNAVPGVKKIAWAASVGFGTLTEDDKRILRHNFEAISVREQAHVNLIPGSILLPDPTMMLSAEEWKELVRPVDGEYLLAYPMLYKEEVVERARQLADELHLELKVLAPGIKLGSGWIQKASPDEFVSLFCHASYVVTSSFHGAVFSLLFDKPHTFIFHDDPRYDTLLGTDMSRAKAVAEAFVNEHLK